jgi:hypothetical protein
MKQIESPHKVQELSFNNSCARHDKSLPFTVYGLEVQGLETTCVYLCSHLLKTIKQGFETFENDELSILAKQKSPLSFAAEGR